MSNLHLHIATKKGAFIAKNDGGRSTWEISGPHFLGSIIYHMVADPRDNNTILMAARTGHLGPTVFRSEDGGDTWKEAEKPPRFPKKEDGSGKTVEFVFWLTPGHESEPDVWWAGTSPQGLFKSTDGGKNWMNFAGFNDNPDTQDWFDDIGTPAGPLCHSIRVDPRDKDHLFLALSTGGWFETTDGGETWSPRNQGLEACFLPDKYPQYGQCVHNSQLSPANPDIGFQQNHCGVYRINFVEDEKWVRIGQNMPKDVGDFGFALVTHPRDENTIWVLPHDGSDVWPRVPPGAKPAFYKTSDGGQSWTRQDTGLPQEHAYFTVLRQAVCHDFKDPLGIYMGTKSGEVWASLDEGESFHCIIRYLPEIYSLDISSVS